MQPLQPHPQLEKLAQRYVWWEKPAWAYEHPTVFLANMMNIGTWDDLLSVREILGDEKLKEALIEAPPGYFSYRSWDFWLLKNSIFYRYHLCLSVSLNEPTLSILLVILSSFA